MVQIKNHLLYLNRWKLFIDTILVNRVGSPITTYILNTLYLGK